MRWWPRGRQEWWEGVMGKVRPKQVKRIAYELLRRFPDRFSSDFEVNKRVLEEIAIVPSQKLRNRVAGYITSILSSRVAARKAAGSSAEE